MRDALQTASRLPIKPGLEVLLVEDAEHLAWAAAQLVSGVLRCQPRSTLALPTGRTPVGMYAALVEMYRQGVVSFAQAITFNLDEFVGIPRSHPGSYYTYMRRHLFDLVDLVLARAHVPNGSASDLKAECDRYESEITRAGGIDLAVLGIGENGHIGFNEPGSPIDSRTRVVDLTPASAAANAYLFGDRGAVPRQAVTMGVGTILEARRLALLASGRDKASALRQALLGPITSDLPASSLQLHSDVVVLADREAASRLT